MQQKINEVEINGIKVSLQEFQNLQKDPKVRLKEISPGCFIKLERIQG